MAKKKKDNAKNKSDLPKWLVDGINGALSDSVKTVLLPVVLTIILTALGFIFILNGMYIRISIELPAFQVGTGIIISIIIVYASRRSIRKIYKRFKWQSIYGFLWKNNKHDELSGPHCVACKAHIVEMHEGFETQIKTAYKTMRGIKALHYFRCANPNCDSKPIQIEMDLSTLINRVQENYYSTE